MAGPSMSVLPLLLLLLLPLTGFSFQSDELPEDDEEWGITGGSPKIEEVTKRASSSPSSSSRPVRRPSSQPGVGAGLPSDSKSVQFELEHSFGDSEFSSAGRFTARLRTSHHGVQSLAKLRLTRNELASEELEAFEEEIRKDGFYRIRVPANVLNPGQDYVISSVKARCLGASNLHEQFDIYMDKGSVIAVGYGVGDCAYPRILKMPTKWTFDSDIVLRSGEQASRTITLENDFGGGELGDDGATKKQPEKSFWGKYWMYIVPLGIIVLNAITQVANMPEENSGQSGSTQGTSQRAVTAGPRRR